MAGAAINLPVDTLHTKNASLPLVVEKKPREEDTQIKEIAQEDLDAIFKPELFSDPVKETKTEKSNPDSIGDFFSKKLFPITTFSASLVNLISAPVRLYDDKNPLKKIINKVSMVFTKSHLLTCAVAGLKVAFKDKNPFLVFSYAVEGLSAFFGIRKIYLFRGLASGTDGAVASIQNRMKNLGKDFKHNSYTESFKAYAEEIKEVTKEVLGDPAKLKQNDGVHKGIVSSWFMVLGSLFGIGINDTVGAGVRDFSGAINDYSLLEFDSKKAKLSGAFYFSGSIFDFVAHIFGLSDKHKEFRNVFHEVAIALDRVGQFLFQRYLEENENSEKINSAQQKKETLLDSAFA